MQIYFKTRIHSSRMRTTRSISRQGEGVCLSACWDRPPRCGPGDPPGVGLETPLARSPSTSPMGGGLETPLARSPLNFPLGCGPGDTLARSPSTSPLGVGLETPLARSPSISPLGVGLETCKACWDIPLETCCKACWDTTPPMNRMTDRHL